MHKFKVFASLIALAILVGVVYAAYLYFTPHQTAENKEPDILLSADNIIKKFTDNDKETDAAFKNKIIQVSGTIAKIDTPAVIIFDNGGNYIIAANTYLKDSHLKKGDIITLKGSYSGYIINDDMFMIPAEIKLNECFIVPQK
jgi:DNA-binding beta-propeller fold protein YncE